MLDRIEADHSAGYRFSDPGQHIVGTKHLHQAQDLDELPLHKAVFKNCSIADDSQAAHRFNLSGGGAYYAVGSGGAITGRGANLLLIDDPTKSLADANSEAYRRSLHEWFESTAYTRLQGDDAAVVIIATRWHLDDLPGWLLRETTAEGWEVLSLPAIAEVDEGWRREGEALWPRRYNLKRLEQIRATAGGAAWASLYQQTPVAAEGAIFKREWWRDHTPATLPARFEQIVVSLDTAFKAGASNDYSVGLVLGVGETGYYVLDVWRDRVEFPALMRQVEMLALKWKPDRVLIEDKASGQSLIQELQSNSRLAIEPVKIDSDKVTRATACTPLVEAGKVFLPEDADWLADFLEELSSFPAAPHDDMVDALSQALNFTRENHSGIFEFVRDLAMRAARGEKPDLRFVMKFPKSPPKNRNRENLAKWPHIIVNGHFSAGLWPQKTPCTRAIRDPKREFLCIGDSGAERVKFELTGDLCSGQ
jgi:predicted phage terminase large subunit-like protein